MDSRTNDVPDPFLIRFLLGRAAELREHRSGAEVDQRAGCLTLADASEDAREAYTELGLLRFLHLLHRMPLDDVADLMAEHASELAHPLCPLDQPAVDVDESAGHRERVDLRAVHDLERPVELAFV